MFDTFGTSGVMEIVQAQGWMIGSVILLRSLNILYVLKDEKLLEYHGKKDIRKVLRPLGATIQEVPYETIGDC